jgi:serine/threonine-protein kinase HipA
VNRAIDHTLRAFTWADMDLLLKAAGLMRAPRYLAWAREVAGMAQSQWPALLEGAPPAMRQVVLERLKGGVALAQRPV